MRNSCVGESCRWAVLPLFLGLLTSICAAEDRPSPFRLRDGDRVVFLGNAFTERSIASGYLETLLTQAFAGQQVTFRNLGWSGDNVHGHARAGFDGSEKGFARIERRIRETRPTIVFLAYGMVESFEGEDGLPRFLAGVDRLLKLIDGAGARVVFLSPIRHERMPVPLPDPAEHNRRLELYADALREVAQKRGEIFVDLFRDLGDGSDSPAGVRYTDNGIHLSDYGYWAAARVIAAELGLQIPGASISIDLESKDAVRATGISVENFRVAETSIEFEGKARSLTSAPRPAISGARTPPPSSPFLRVVGLPKGRYVLEVDGKVFLRASAFDLAQGVVLQGSSDIDQAEELRRAIQTKNAFYFYQWRPQNNTYLFLFRKHEQGDLASEIPGFGPLIESQEKRIATLVEPRKRAYRIHLEDAEALEKR